MTTLLLSRPWKHPRWLAPAVSLCKAAGKHSQMPTGRSWLWLTHLTGPTGACSALTVSSGTFLVSVLYLFLCKFLWAMRKQVTPMSLVRGYGIVSSHIWQWTDFLTIKIYKADVRRKGDHQSDARSPSATNYLHIVQPLPFTQVQDTTEIYHCRTEQKTSRNSPQWLESHLLLQKVGIKQLPSQYFSEHHTPPCKYSLHWCY